jgi:arginase
LENYGEDLCVLWIDAHMDLNTPETSPTGNLHGMPLAVLTKMVRSKIDSTKPDWLDTSLATWKSLEEIVPEHCLRKDGIAWLGLRSVDEGEVSNFGNLDGSLALTMQDIDQFGLNESMNKLKNWIVDSGCKYIWISFDVDVLDPIFAPGTGTAVRGGLTYREGHFIAETLNEWLFGKGLECKLAGLDLVEVNPLCDQGNETARMANEWLCSLFGRRIMGSGGR